VLKVVDPAAEKVDGFRAPLLFHPPQLYMLMWVELVQMMQVDGMEEEIHLVPTVAVEEPQM
jgi:hypothetical protein